MALMGTVAGDPIAALLSCLANEDLCTSVQRSSAESGSFSTPHPYENNASYLFEVSLPTEGKAITWQFDEFEVDIHDDGSCLDEVYIFEAAAVHPVTGTPGSVLIAHGPFCGFDDAFNAGLESIQYDYYYEQLLNTVNLGEFGSEIVQMYPILVGLKTGDHVRNYGFSFSWQISG